MRKKRCKIERELDELIRLSKQVDRALRRHPQFGKWSGRYTKEMRRAFAEGEEAGRRLAARLFDFKGDDCLDYLRQRSKRVWR